LKRVYSDREAFLLKRQVEQDIWDAEQEAKEWLAKAVEMADSSRAYTQAAKERMNQAEKKVRILQEIGLYDKPGTKREEPESEEEDERTQVIFEMDEAVEKKMEEEGVEIDAN